VDPVNTDPDLDPDPQHWKKKNTVHDLNRISHELFRFRITVSTQLTDYSSFLNSPQLYNCIQSIAYKIILL